MNFVTVPYNSLGFWGYALYWHSIGSCAFVRVYKTFIPKRALNLVSRLHMTLAMSDREFYCGTNQTIEFGRA